MEIPFGNLGESATRGSARGNCHSFASGAAGAEGSAQCCGSTAMVKPFVIERGNYPELTLHHSSPSLLAGELRD